MGEALVQRVMEKGSAQELSRNSAKTLGQNGSSSGCGAVGVCSAGALQAASRGGGAP